MPNLHEEEMDETSNGGVLALALFFVSMAALAGAVTEWLDSGPRVFTSFLGPPPSVLLYAGMTVLGAIWWHKGAVQWPFRKILALALIALPLAGLLGTFAGVPDARETGGFAGYSVATTLLSFLPHAVAWGFALILVAFSAWLAFQLAFSAPASDASPSLAIAKAYARQGRQNASTEEGVEAAGEGAVTAAATVAASETEAFSAKRTTPSLDLSAATGAVAVAATGAIAGAAALRDRTGEMEMVSSDEEHDAIETDDHIDADVQPMARKDSTPQAEPFDGTTPLVGGAASVRSDTEARPYDPRSLASPPIAPVKVETNDAESLEEASAVAEFDSPDDDVPFRPWLAGFDELSDDNDTGIGSLGTAPGTSFSPTADRDPIPAHLDQSRLLAGVLREEQDLEVPESLSAIREDAANAQAASEARFAALEARETGSVDASSDPELLNEVPNLQALVAEELGSSREMTAEAVPVPEPTEGLPTQSAEKSQAWADIPAAQPEAEEEEEWEELEEGEEWEEVDPEEESDAEEEEYYEEEDDEEEEWEYVEEEEDAEEESAALEPDALSAEEVENPVPESAEMEAEAIPAPESAAPQAPPISAISAKEVSVEAPEPTEMPESAMVVEEPSVPSQATVESQPLDKVETSSSPAPASGVSTTAARREDNDGWATWEEGSSAPAAAATSATESPVSRPTPSKTPEPAADTAAQSKPAQSPLRGEEQPTLFAHRSEVDDSTYTRAVELVTGEDHCSAAMLQRYVKVSFSEATAIIERMYDEGIVGPQLPSGRREILYEGGRMNDTAQA